MRGPLYKLEFGSRQTLEQIKTGILMSEWTRLEFEIVGDREVDGESRAGQACPD